MHLASGGLAAAVDAYDGSIFGDGSNVVAQVDAGSFLGVSLTNEAILNGNATTGAGTLTEIVSVDSTVVTPQTVATINGPFFEAQAAQMQYSPVTPANWSGVAPTSVAGALDRIAAKIGPIP